MAQHGAAPYLLCVLFKFVVAALLVVGCSLPDPQEGHCTSDGDDGLARSVNPGPDCNGEQHADECASAGLPAAYGVETGCLKPATWTDGARCRPRPKRLEGCVALGAFLLCCPP